MKIPAFSFLKPKLRENTLAAVGLLRDGVAVAKVTREPEHPAVLDFCEYQDTADEASSRSALEHSVRRHGLGNVRCTSVLCNDEYSLLLVEAPEVPDEELKAAVKWRIKDLVDFSVEDAVLDVFDAPAQKSGRQGRMIYVAAARSPVLEARSAMAKEAGLNLSVVDIPELAQRNLAACLPEDAGGVALLYLSADSGLITLTCRSVLYLTRRLDFGIDDLGELSDAGANGDEPPAQVRGWLDRLVIEVQRSLDYFESNFSQAPIANLAIAPLERAVPGIETYFNAQLGLTTRILNVTDMLDCAVPVDPTLQARCFPVIGAALRTEPA